MLTLVREAMGFVLAMRTAIVQSCIWPWYELTLGFWKHVEEGSSVARSRSCMYSSKFQERNTCSMLLLRVSSALKYLRTS